MKEKENESESSEDEKYEEETEKEDQINPIHNTAPNRKTQPKYSISINPRQLIFGTRGSIAASLYRPEHRRIKTAPNIYIQKERVAKKTQTRLHKELEITKEKISYPLENLRPLSILEKTHKELIFLYITEGELEFLLMHNKSKKNVYAIPEEKIIGTLQYHLKIYYQNIFKSKGNLEERLLISMSEKMKSIKPNYTIAIEMDDKLKNSDIVKKQIVNFLDIKNFTDQKEIIKIDPFSKIKSKENNEHEDRELLPKWAVSLKNKIDEMSDDETSEDELSRKQSENFDDVIFEDNIIKKYTVENINNEIKESKKEDENDNEENKTDNEESENEGSENKGEDENNEEKEENVEEEDEEEKDPYKECIKDLFYPKFDDFRKEIIDHLLKNQIFDKMNFEKFICLLEFFITLFTGIQVKYTIDERCFLNMDLYADELIYMNMAEVLHYQVQFQIRDISHSINHEKRLNPKRIIELNKCPYEDFLLDKIEFFPPSTAFIEGLSNHFRRYTHDDNYHLCQECEKLFSIYKYQKTNCDSSVFRFIDKVRLLTMTLFSILDIHYLELMIEKNEDNEEEEQYINFKGTMILRNEDVFNEFKITYIIKAYLCPKIIKPILKLNHIFRNIFGEIIGYYYTWVSHYISWMIFPALLGLITEILINFVIVGDIQNLIYLIFLVSILLWGFYYVRDWKKKEKFYNHIWGMDSFQAEITNLYDENYSKVPYVTFLGMKIPKVDKISTLMSNVISVALVLLSSLFIMGVNVGIFKVNNTNFFINKFINKIFTFFGVSKDISKYTLPILIYIVREIISKIFYKISAILAKLERPVDKEEYDAIVIKKRLTLEFVNYYFNLYYILLYKKKKNKCEDGDCFQELRKQLILILISNICSVIGQFVYRIIDMKKNINDFKKKQEQAFKIHPDYIEKLKFYNRELFTEDNVQKLILPIIFNFGYVIQFGICCPISFFFMLILIIFIRLTNAISMIYIYYVKTISIFKGFTVYNNTQYLFVFLGLFSNLCILLYTKNSSSEIKLIYKLIIIVLVQNGVMVICNIIRFKSLPFWFRYRKIIKLKYLKNFGVIHNKTSSKKNIDIINNDNDIASFKFY